MVASLRTCGLQTARRPRTGADARERRGSAPRTRYLLGMSDFRLARVLVLVTQAARVSLPYTHPRFAAACRNEIAARVVLATMPEHQAELDGWRARAVAAMHRRRLRRAMTPAARGGRSRPRCA